MIYYHDENEILYEIPLNEPKMSKFSNKFISAGHSHYVRNQEIHFYVLSAKFINDHQYQFSKRETIEILN